MAPPFRRPVVILIILCTICSYTESLHLDLPLHHHR